jgi:hypothetical protein
MSSDAGREPGLAAEAAEELLPRLPLATSTTSSADVDLAFFTIEWGTGDLSHGNLQPGSDDA